MQQIFERRALENTKPKIRNQSSGRRGAEGQPRGRAALRIGSHIRVSATGADSVQRVGKLKAGNGKLPAIAGFEWEFADLERLDAAPSVQLIARDTFVADMAIKLDQMQIETRALARELRSCEKVDRGNQGGYGAKLPFFVISG